MADINLSKAVRSNLLSLQSTAAQMAKTQERLATGLKVNSALDNPTNFFTAASLNSRAGDMANLLDSMSNGISTIQAADNGLKSITKTVESMQSTLRQARQDKSFQTASYTIADGLDDTDTLDLTGGALTAPVSIELGTAATPATDATLTGAVAVGDDTALQALSGPITITADNGDTVTYEIDNTSTIAALEGALSADGFAVAFDASDNLAITRADGVNFTVSGAGGTALGFTGGNVTSTDGVEGTAAASKSVDQLVTEINGNNAINTAIRASNDNGKLRIENLSTEDLTVGGHTTDTIGGNDVRKNLEQQFNDLRDQLDKFADDASFNGINLLRGDLLKLTFNETGTSTIEIQAKDAAGAATSINNTTLGITSVVGGDFDSDDAIDSRLDVLSNALNSLRSHASSFGSNLSIVENRQDFTKNMINTLETGAANLTLADTNEEAANLLALQTRQQLSSTALSMASQADQAVLRLF